MLFIFFYNQNNNNNNNNNKNKTKKKVAGHYPISSIAEHGPTQNLIDKLKPMMLKYNAQVQSLFVFLFFFILFTHFMKACLKYVDNGEGCGCGKANRCMQKVCHTPETC